VFQIAELPLLAGRIGSCPLPGRTGDYAGDLAIVLSWQPSLVVSLTSDIELESAGAEEIGADLVRAGVTWRHLPVCDFRAPSAETSARWPEFSLEARGVLAQGGAVLAHCYGGCGRSGMALLRLMVDAGEAPNSALERLRQVQSCAVESAAQFAWAGGEVRGWTTTQTGLVTAASFRT
jgi:protein-tyrosine phosphatase